MHVPTAPTAEEWRDHQITHAPFNPWCDICVKNAAMNNPHKMKHHSRTSAVFCMNYMHMTKKPNEEQIMHPILVVKERVTDGVWAIPVIRKGAVKQVIEIIVSCAKFSTSIHQYEIYMIS